MATRKEEKGSYWDGAWGKPKLRAFLEKKGVRAHEAATEKDEDGEEEDEGVLDLLHSGICANPPVFDRSKPEDVERVEATATKHAGGLFTVPCRLQSVVPKAFPSVLPVLVRSVHQGNRLRDSAYEFVHAVLMLVMGHAGTPDAGGWPKFSMQPNWAGELLLGSTDAAANKHRPAWLPTLDKLMRPWELDLQTCDQHVRDALEFYKTHLQPREGDHAIPMSYMDNIIRRHKTRFVAECAVHLMSHAVVDDVETHLAHVHLGGGHPTGTNAYQQRRQLRQLLRTAKGAWTPEMCRGLSQEQLQYVADARKILWPGLADHSTKPRTPTGPLWSSSDDTGAITVGVASLHLHVARHTPHSSLIPHTLNPKHCDGCLRAAEVEHGEVGLPAQLRCESVMDSLGWQLLAAVRWLQLFQVLLTSFQQQQAQQQAQQQQQQQQQQVQPKKRGRPRKHPAPPPLPPQQQQQDQEEVQVQVCWSECLDRLRQLESTAHKAASDLENASDAASLQSFHQACPKATDEEGARCEAAFQSVRDAATSTLNTLTTLTMTDAVQQAAVPTQQQVSTMLDSLLGAKRVYGGAVWQCRVVRAEVRSCCCSECGKSARAWLKRQERQRVALRKQGVNPDDEVLFKMPAGGAVRAYCPLADPTKRAFVQIDGNIVKYIVHQALSGLQPEYVRKAVDDAGEGLPWGWKEVAKKVAKADKKLNVDEIGRISCSVTAWLAVSPGTFNAAAYKRHHEAIRRMRSSLEDLQKKVKSAKPKKRPHFQALRDDVRDRLKRAQARGYSRISKKDYTQAFSTDGVGARILLHRHRLWEEVVRIGQHRAEQAAQARQAKPPPPAQGAPNWPANVKTALERTKTAVQALSRGCSEEDRPAFADLMKELEERALEQAPSLSIGDCMRWLEVLKEDAAMAPEAQCHLRKSTDAVEELWKAMAAVETARARQKEAGLHYECGDPSENGPLGPMRPMRLRTFDPGRGHHPEQREQQRQKAWQQQQLQQQQQGAALPSAEEARPVKRQKVGVGGDVARTSPQRVQQRVDRKQHAKAAKERREEARKQPWGGTPGGEPGGEPICVGIDVGAANLMTAVTFKATADLTSSPMQQPPYFQRHACRELHHPSRADCPNHKLHEIRHLKDGSPDYHHPGKLQVPGCRKLISEGGSSVASYSRQQRAAECRHTEVRMQQEERMASFPGLKELFAVMGCTGGAHDSSSSRKTYLWLLRHFNPVVARLREDDGKAWARQTALERGRSSMDSAWTSVLRTAVEESDLTAPIVITIGPTPSVGMGNAPSKKLEAALMRAVARGAGGCSDRRVSVVTLSEYHTTRCCFRCGAEGDYAEFIDKNGKKARSMRLRQCTECFTKSQQQCGKPTLKQLKGGTPRIWTVDRDVQAAWNMALLGAAWSGGQCRPYHLSSPELKERWLRNARESAASASSSL